MEVEFWTWVESSVSSIYGLECCSLQSSQIYRVCYGSPCCARFGIFRVSSTMFWRPDFRRCLSGKAERTVECETRFFHDPSDSCERYREGTIFSWWCPVPCGGRSRRLLSITRLLDLYSLLAGSQSYWKLCVHPVNPTDLKQAYALSCLGTERDTRERCDGMIFEILKEIALV